jgi:hypothetical protein
MPKLWESPVCVQSGQRLERRPGTLTNRLSSPTHILLGGYKTQAPPQVGKPGRLLLSKGVYA